MSLAAIIAKLTLLNPEQTAPYLIHLSNEGLVFSFTTLSDCDKIFAERGSLRILKQDLNVIVAHDHLQAFLLHLGANPMGLTDAIEGYYLKEKRDRAYHLAQESTRLDALSFPMHHVNCVSVGLAAQPNQLLGKISITLPETHTVEVTSPSRVVFMLDRSGSMAYGCRLMMVKQALLNTLDRLPQETLVSIYFYDDKLMRLAESLPISALTPELRQRIDSIMPGGGTQVNVAVQGLLAHMHETGVMHNPHEYKNLTVVWLTDGEDGSVHSVDEFVAEFTKVYPELPPLTELPRLIAMGIGSYNQRLINGVAQDYRFKTNLMLHISSPAETARLFQVVSQNVGVSGQRVILAITVDGELTYQDLNYMKIHETKTLITEINLPAHKAPSMVHDMVISLIIDEKIYRQWINLSLFPHRHIEDTLLLKAYYEQCKNRYIVARVNAPADAEHMREMMLRFIPSHTEDTELRAIRYFFHTCGQNTSDKKRSLLKAEIDEPAWNAPRFFSSQTDQRSYSQSLVERYSSI